MKPLKLAFSGKKVLITGGLGFMGSNLAHRLVDFGSEVTLLDACLFPYGANMKNIDSIKDDVKFVKMDIRDGCIREHVARKDFIFHLAGEVGHYNEKVFPKYTEDAESINYDGTLKLLSICSNFNPDVMILFSGSSFQYGIPKYIPVDEKHPLEPSKDMPYAISKNKADKLCSIFHEKMGLNTVRVRIANPYGPRSQMRHPNYGFLNWFIRKAIDNQPIEIYGGQQRKDMVYIDDLVDAFLSLAAEKNSIGEAFNVGSGRGYSIRELAEKVVDIVGRGWIEYAETPEKYLRVGTPSYVSCIDKINALTGWIPSVNISDGIARTFEFYQVNRESYW